MARARSASPRCSDFDRLRSAARSAASAVNFDLPGTPDLLSPHPRKTLHPSSNLLQAATKMVHRAHGLRGFGRGFEGDVIAEAFEAALEIGNRAAFPDLVEIGFAEIAIDHAPGEHVIGGYDNLVSNGQGGPQRAAAGL